MRHLLLLIITFWSCALCGQVISGVKAVKIPSDFTATRDSVTRLLKAEKTITIKTCDNSKEWFLTENDSGWTGYFLKYTMPDFNRTTTVISFLADSLSKIIVTQDLFKIEQLTEDSLNSILTHNLNTKRKNVKYILGEMSHDCNMTIIIGKGQKYVSYRNYVISSKDLHTNNTIKTFYDIRELLDKLDASYEH